MRWGFVLTALAFVLVPELAEAARCRVSATGVAFGLWTQSAMTAAGTVTVNCNGGDSASYTIALGAGSSGTFSARTLLSGANRLIYDLYADSTHTQIWGDGTGGTATVAGSESGTYTIYGLIPMQTAPAPGTYSDTITVTVAY